MKTTIKSLFVALAIASVSVVFLAGCNTVKGVGQDMQQGGQQLQNAAYENQH